jgi:RNA polymerase sigma-70 factor, ECF subfamily
LPNLFRFGGVPSYQGVREGVRKMRSDDKACGVKTVSGSGSGGETLSQAERDRYCDLLDAVASRQDRSAYAELFSYYAPRLKSYLMRLGADSSLAEEITQDVMVTVWRKAGLFDRRQASVSTWIFRIARNRRIDLFRRSKKPDLDPEEPMILPSGVEQPDRQLEARETEAQVRAAMKDLPVEQLEMLKLAFYEGLSHREIAEKLDLPLGTVKSRIRLAFVKMRSTLGEEDPE